MNDIIDEILKNHTLIRERNTGITRPIVYDVGDGIDVYIKQNYNNIVLWVFDNKEDKFIDIENSILNKLISELRKIAINITVDAFVYYVELDLSKMKISVQDELNLDRKSKRKIIGYCRNGGLGYLEENLIEFQEKVILNEYKDAIIYRENFTGRVLDRPVINEVLKDLESGDILVITKLDRLVLNVKDGITILDKLFNRNIIVHVLNVGILENSRMGRFFIQTMLATVEMESTMLREKIKAGKIVAKQKPDFKEGRPKLFTEEEIEKALSMLLVNGGKFSYDKVAEITKISKSTLIRENKKRK